MSAVLADSSPNVPPSSLAELTARIAAGSARHDTEGSFPHENFPLLHQQGLLALTVPQAFGGEGAGLERSREVVAAVARGDAATALVLTMQLLQTRAVGRPDCRWPEELRIRVLRSAARDGALCNALRVEPELGTPARGGLPATTIRRTPGGWRLSGRKIYSTGIDGLTWLMVWARSDEEPARVGTVLVPRHAPGVRIERTWDSLGLRASASHDVAFDDVRLPEDHAVDLRDPAEWADRADPEPTHWINVLLATIYDAVARNARDWLLQFLLERAPSALGAPLATLPRAQEAVGEIELLLQASRVQLDSAAADADAGRPWSSQASGLLKTAVTRNAIEVVERALRLTGNHGLARRNPLERWHRDVLCGRIHTPQEDSACIAAGRAALGS
jgi:alkylation response protein AidB-like acyl-CoA dehydrogenase